MPLLLLPACESGGGDTQGAGRLSIIALDVTGGVAAGKAPLPARFAGDAGSRVESFQVRLDTFELKREDGTYVTVYSGAEYLETIGTGAGSVAGMLQGVMPPAGTYTGYRATPGAFRINAVLVQGGSTHYTTPETVTFDVAADKPGRWTLTTASADRGPVTVAGSSGPSAADFPTPLTVSADQDVSLLWVTERSGTVLIEDSLPDDVFWVNSEELIRATLPAKPSKLVQFKLAVDRSPTVGGTVENTVSFFLDAEGALLGGFCHRPSNSAINCSTLKSGSLAGDSFTLTFWDGNNVGTFLVSGTYNCAATTYGSLAESSTGDVSRQYTPGTDTLQSSGPLECYDI